MEKNRFKSTQAFSDDRSIQHSGQTTAKELIDQTEREAATTPMDAVLDAAQN